jgi:hypothetical protein
MHQKSKWLARRIGKTALFCAAGAPDTCFPYPLAFYFSSRFAPGL